MHTLLVCVGELPDVIRGHVVGLFNLADQNGYYNELNLVKQISREQAQICQPPLGTCCGLLPAAPRRRHHATPPGLIVAHHAVILTQARICCFSPTNDAYFVCNPMTRS